MQLISFFDSPIFPLHVLGAMRLAKTNQF